jgi:hypothetical protein
MVFNFLSIHESKLRHSPPLPTVAATHNTQTTTQPLGCSNMRANMCISVHQPTSPAIQPCAPPSGGIQSEPQRLTQNHASALGLGLARALGQCKVHHNCLHAVQFSSAAAAGQSSGQRSVAVKPRLLGGIKKGAGSVATSTLNADQVLATARLQSRQAAQQAAGQARGGDMQHETIGCCAGCSSKHCSLQCSQQPSWSAHALGASSTTHTPWH